VWNEDEVKFTGAREKADSWWRMTLSKGSGPTHDQIDVGGENFTFDTLQTNSAYFRAQSDDNIGLVGVLVEGTSIDVSSVTLNHAGKRNGLIKWRTQDDEAPEKM
jgi:hypothetical protein